MNLLSTKTTDFVTNFVYEDGQLAHVNTPEGRIVYNTKGTIRQEFNLKDHLGNVRVVYSVENGVVTTRQIDNYYPFGYNIKGLSVNKYATTRPNEYLYNGKMMQDEMGLNWLDYGARMYDAALGRWHVIDPLSEVSRRWSPYTYGKDNPILFIDPDGMLDEVYITGPDADKATEEVNKSSSLEITRDAETGKLSATGEATTDSDKVLLEAIQSESVIVNLETKSEATYDSKDGGTNVPLVPAGFEGSEVRDGKTVATQYLNLEAAQNVATILGEQTGETIIHEIKEAYIGGRDYPGGDFNSAFQASHEKAASTDRVKADLEYNHDTKSDPNNIITQGRIPGSGNTWVDIIKIPK